MNRKAHVLLWYWMPVIIYCTLIFIQSAYPSPVQMHLFTHSDKFLHLCGYGVMGALFYRAFLASTAWRQFRFPLLLGVSATALYGATDEYHQSLVAYRSADLMDLYADIIGGAIGACLYHLVKGRHKPLSREKIVD